MENIKTYEIERNNLVYEQVIGLGKPYCKWCDGDWEYVKTQLKAIYETQGEDALLDFFNKIMYNVVKVKWK
tara:strand:+ start:801 stop:1013 length:213 start_codon:yes stop_codon:yes gene_type:complete